MAKRSLSDVISASDIERITGIMTNDLQLAAMHAGWPQAVYSELVVEYEAGNLVVSYPDSIKAEVEDLEYGKEGHLPNAVIRPFKSRAGLYIKEIAETIIDNLMAGAF